MQGSSSSNMLPLLYTRYGILVVWVVGLNNASSHFTDIGLRLEDIDIPKATGAVAGDRKNYRFDKIIGQQ